MTLFLIGVLFHKPHEEDEEDGGSGDSYNDGNHHDSSSQVSANCDVSIADRHLRNHLIVETGYERVQFRIHLTT